MPAATVVSSVSTAAVQFNDRLAYWEHYNADALVGLTCKTYQPDGLLARELNLSLESVRVADIEANSHAVERAPETVRSLPKDATFVSMMVAGDAFFYHAGGCLSLRPGDTVIYNPDRPYMFGFGGQMRQLLVDIPRDLFSEICGPGTATDAPVLVPGEAGGTSGMATRALRRLLLDLVEKPAAAQDDVQQRVLELVAALPGSRGSSANAHLVTAKAYISEHLGDPRLCGELVARSVGLTLRHLNRAFAADQTTVAQYIVARRLDRAKEDLAAPDLTHLRVADIAFRWGFASQAHFSRLFRDRFGCSPSDLRPR